MQELMSAIQNELGNQGLSSIAEKLGLDTEQAQKAVAVALPAITGALAKNSSDAQGAEALANALDRDHQSPLTETLGGLLGAVSSQQSGGLLGGLAGLAAGALSSSAGASKATDGLGILGHLFGGKLSGIQQSIAQATGLSTESIASLLQMLAPIAMSSLGTLKATRGFDASSLAGFLQEQAPGEGSTNLFASLLDQDGDGSMSDDLLQMGGKLLQSGALNSFFSA